MLPRMCCWRAADPRGQWVGVDVRGRRFRNGTVSVAMGKRVEEEAVDGPGVKVE